jgi:hypothetical protein
MPSDIPPQCVRFSVESSVIHASVLLQPSAALGGRPAGFFNKLIHGAIRQYNPKALLRMPLGKKHQTNFALYSHALLW